MRKIIILILSITTMWGLEVNNTAYTAYTTNEHLGGAITNQIAEDMYGNLFFANESGLLKFDGENWSLMPTTRQSSYISSTVTDWNNRIWISSPQTIGYYSTDSHNGYVYHDLTSSISDAGIGTFWKLYADRQYIYLITATHVLRWNGECWEQWSFEVERRILPSWINDTLYIHARGTGIFRFTGGDFDLIADETKAISSGIISVIEENVDGLLCATISNGLFVMKDGAFRPSKIPIKTSQIFHAQNIGDGYILFSTGEDGILIINRETNEVSRVSHNKSSSFHIHEHSSGAVWAATTNSILEISNTRLSYYSDNAYDIIRQQENIFYTNGNELKVAYSNAKSSPPKTLLEGTAIWDLHPTNTDLLYGGYKIFGIFDNENATQEITHPRHVTSFYPSNNPDLVYTNDPPTISRWSNGLSGWEHVDSLSEFNSRALSLVELPNGKLLISTENSSLLLVTWPLEPNESEPTSITPLTEAHGLPDKFIWAHCLRLNENVIVISNRGLYRYDNETETFDYDPALGNDLGTDAYGLEYCPAADGNDWVLRLPSAQQNQNIIGQLSFNENQHFNWTPWQLPSLHLAGKVEALLHETIDGVEALWVGGSKDLLRYDLSNMPQHPAPHTRLTAIREQQNNQAYYNGAGAAPKEVEWSYPQKDLRIDFAAPPSPIVVTGYRTRLIGFNDTWTEPSKSTFREFTNLSHGTYTFEAQAIDEFGRTGTSAQFSFKILPPWYRTVYAYFAYVVISILIILIANRWNSRRLRLRNEALEALINERTYQLEDQKLKLIKANKAKQNFLASMSHEIRNPLNGVIGIARILRERQQTAGGQVSEELTHLHSCSTHLHQLLGQTLDYSSLEAGKLGIKMESFNPSTLLDEAIHIQQKAADEKGLTLSLTKPNLPYHWKGDPTLLRQILINLLSNGIKYTPTGSVSLTLSYKETEDSVRTCFEVVDTGPGIPKDQQTMVFEEFTRLPESEASQIPGTGLGLTISSEMAQLMGGDLSLDGAYQSGARFVLNLEFGIDLLPLKKSVSDQDHSLTLSGKKVLIADDMDFNRYISAEILRSMGADIDEAEDGLVALNLLKSSTYHIAILDISMPNMTGPEVVESFLKDHHGPPPEFIALSAYSNPEMEAKCRTSGFDDFIEKPLDPEKLQKRLLRYSRASHDSKGSTTDILQYLSESGTKPLSELQDQYQKSFKKELDQLKLALIKDDLEAQRDIIHKLLGLCNVHKDQQVNERVEALSKLSKEKAPKEAFVEIIENLKTQIDQMFGS
ncbi:MAG: ATP-binding protein [Opitutaceae bacterium]